MFYNEVFGVLFAISAPSGTGKSTLIKALIKNQYCINNINLSISYTTRVRRSGEIHGKDYYFISIKEFECMIRANAFLEYAKVFNHYYGTAKNSIEVMLANGINVILDIDWNGIRQIRSKTSNIYTIFILPPSKEELNRRLKIRAQDAKEVISFRLKQTVDIVKHIKEYDYIIINDNFDVACKHLQSIILSEQLRYVHQEIRYKKLINNFIKSS